MIAEIKNPLNMIAEIKNPLNIRGFFYEQI